MTKSEKIPITEYNDEPSGTIAPGGKSDAYILGGGDLEMLRIKQRLQRVGAKIVGEVTTWEGADISNREQEIQTAINDGHNPVLVEHRGADEDARVEHIDHHGENSHREAAILQVLTRTGLEPNLIDKIIAANDSSYIPGMKQILDENYRQRFIDKRTAAGTTTEVAEERYRSVCARIISSVRREDRKAQGVTEEMEKEGADAVEAMVHRDGLNIVTIDGDRTSVVTDLVAMRDIWKDETEDRIEDNLVVVCTANLEEKEVWFFGPGDVAKATQEHFQELKRQRIENDPNEPARRGRYHTVGGGQGFGLSDQIARCLVVAPDSEEVISQVLKLEKEKQLGA
jgi:hypothetical protein